MKVDMYSVCRGNMVVFVPEGVDPGSVALPDDLVVSAADVVNRGADLEGELGRATVDALYAVLDIVATGFFLLPDPRRCGGSPESFAPAG